MAENKSLMAGQQLPTPKKKKKKVSYITKKKKYTGKRYDTSALAAGQQVLTEQKGRKDRGKKVYGATEAGEISRAKAKKAMTADNAYSFKEAFAKARGGGSDKFTFKGKSYLTKKPSELKKKSWREKLTGYKTQSEYEAAKTKRIKEKRVARMEKRKGEGKSYSAKNLAELKGSKKKSTDIAKAGKAYYENLKKPTYITKKKKKTYSISS